MYGKYLAFSVVWWSYGKSLAFSVPRLVLWLFSRVFWGSGGPMVNLSRFPWSGGPTVNLSRYLLLFAGCRWPRGDQACASCVAAFVWWSHGKSFAFSVVWWSYGKSLAFSVPRLVLR